VNPSGNAADGEAAVGPGDGAAPGAFDHDAHVGKGLLRQTIDDASNDVACGILRSESDGTEQSKYEREREATDNGHTEVLHRVVSGTALLARERDVRR
jgi:hypothetical protein